jgi:hypothetical protein
MEPRTRLSTVGVGPGLAPGALSRCQSSAAPSPFCSSMEGLLSICGLLLRFSCFSPGPIGKMFTMANLAHTQE